jgi:hypothetical protein
MVAGEYPQQGEVIPPMLRVSTNAVALLEENRRTQGIPDTHGIRIFGEGDGEGGIKVRMAFVEDPIATDHASASRACSSTSPPR